MPTCSRCTRFAGSQLVRGTHACPDVECPQRAFGWPVVAVYGPPPETPWRLAETAIETLSDPEYETANALSVSPETASAPETAKLSVSSGRKRAVRSDRQYASPADRLRAWRARKAERGGPEL